MNKTKMMFFVSCPSCKRKFGVEPRFIMMYLSRVIARYKERFGRISEMLQAAQEDVRARREQESVK